MNDMAIGPTDGTGLPSVANVRFEIEVEGTGGPWLVERVSLTEAVSEPLRGVVEARVAADPPLAAELLGKELTLRIEREGQLRVVRAIVRHATTSSSLEDTRVTFHLVSSIWRLGLGIDTRTYLDVTIPELVREVVRERLGGAVTVDVDGLTQTYRRHEMIVQYQESYLSFLSRWMEQEGIFWFVAESDEGERMVLADAMENLPLARASEDGRVRHLGEWNAALEREAVSDLRHGESLGVTRVTLSELDWTRPSMPIRAERNAGGPLQPPGEIYDHSDAVTLHGFDGRQYTEDTAERGAQIRSEALALARHRWTMRSNVVTAAAGHVLRIEGAPEADLDGAYMIVRTDGEGRAHRDGVGTWSCSHVLVPTSMPYRPIPKTPRPIVPGPETAFVVGPAGQEIHTDLHGRVKVHFHWDRIRGRDEESSSCWVRVAQRWAGDGFGTFFLPRIGMEVVVDFLGGNPDRPIVTGCVHNGEAFARVDLPAQKTQSYIRTKSSTNSDGYNEIRFEDHAGAEFISVHAQRNLLERVLHDHRTHVDHDQRNEVGNDQELIVHGNRKHTVDKDEEHTIRQNRSLRIEGDDTQHVLGTRRTTIDTDETLDVLNNREIHVMGGETRTIDRGLTMTVTTGIEQTITSGGWTMTTTGGVSHTIDGSMLIDASGSMKWTAGGKAALHADGAVEVTGESIDLKSNTEIRLSAPNGIRHVTPAKEEHAVIQAYHNAQEHFENVGAKLGIYSMALTIALSKVDLTGRKVDLYVSKIDNSSFKKKQHAVTIENNVTVNIQVAAVVIIN